MMTLPPHRPSDRPDPSDPSADDQLSDVDLNALDDSADERPSKTQRKKEMTELQQLGTQLLKLSSDQLARIDLPERLRDALREAQRITSFEAKRRQLQYVGKLMRSVDPEPIRAALAAATGDSRAAVALMHRCERWRERLLDDDAALTELLQDHPGADVQQLRATIRAARRENATQPPSERGGKHARVLYRYLHQLFAQSSASDA